MKKKQELGQFYTTNSDYILKGLLDVFPPEEIVIDPFGGKGDLLKYFKKFESYDIDPKRDDIQKRDTLINPLDYRVRWICTNPPYFAKNKNKNKTIYEKYETSDLYKASMKSLIDCEGGVLIVPFNLFCDRETNFRRFFFSKFEVIQLNVFENSTFEDTDLSVCSFSFRRKENIKQKIKVVFFPKEEVEYMEISYEHGYRLYTDFYSEIETTNGCYFKRLVEGKRGNTNIFLRAIDTGTLDGKIKLEYNEKQYYGSATDRAFATIVSKIKLSEDQQNLLIERFNEELNLFREKYRSIFLTNYRNCTADYSRKRISFKLTYNLLQYVYEKYLV